MNKNSKYMTLDNTHYSIFMCRNIIILYRIDLPGTVIITLISRYVGLIV